MRGKGGGGGGGHVLSPPSGGAELYEVFTVKGCSECLSQPVTPPPPPTTIIKDCLLNILYLCAVCKVSILMSSRGFINSS